MLAVQMLIQNKTLQKHTMHNMHLNVISIAHVLFSAIKPTNITHSSVCNRKQVQ